MPEFRISRNSVAGCDDGAVCWAVVEPIWPNTSDADEFEHVSKGTAGQQAIYYTMLFAREVDNGGLCQFFLNKTGNYWQEIATSLDILAAEEHLAALETVLKYFPVGKPATGQSLRQKIIANLSKGELDDIAAIELRLYNLGGFERRLVPYWKSYIDRHSEEFFF